MSTVEEAPISSPRRRRPRPVAGPPQKRDQSDHEAISPLVPRRFSSRGTNPLLRVQRVGRHAAMTTKQVVWDSNAASIEAAISAVDQWEAAYAALRGLMVAFVKSARGIYCATKDGAGKIEVGFMMPVRDWVILPTFYGVEQAAMGTVGFFQSDEASQLGLHTLEVVKGIPVVGENFVAPVLVFSVGFVQRSWEIAQYPIPSKQQVRDSVDFAMNGAKWALSTGFREVCLYVKRADANITRTLSHTQWKVLGSGPYATLSEAIKKDVIDHLCERYLSISDPVGRFELASHIRFHNRPLYNDVVLSGLLKERGCAETDRDEWLSPYPSYRTLDDMFMVGGNNEVEDAQIRPLWFRLPYVNGKHPGKDAAWVCCRNQEQRGLEKRYREIIRLGDLTAGAVSVGTEEKKTPNGPQKYPTIAKWYDPDAKSDVMIDQNRHAVSFSICCPVCRKKLSAVEPPEAPRQIGDICKKCSKRVGEPSAAAATFNAPALKMVMRPTLWRFYGSGDDVRRSNWFVDTSRHGLQPFGEEAQAILEDAYLFLRWINTNGVFYHEDGFEGALLTVEVPSLSGGSVLVQFSSLTHATAIHKGLGAAIAIFKRRVYRGAWLLEKKQVEEKRRPRSITESIMQAVDEHGTLGDTMVPDVSIRSILMPSETPSKLDLLVDGMGTDAASDDNLAVPPERLYEDDMAKHLVDHKDHEIDHVVLIVHGIGEMMQSMDVFGMALPNLSSIVECCGFLRKNHVEVEGVRSAEFKPKFSNGRVEYLPVEWHEAFSILSRRKFDKAGKARDSVTLKDISLRTIPQMREFANDTLMDVLYFMSPEHHDTIVDVVANEMNVVVEKFRLLTGFTGSVSLIGHSLGSIISWDILSNQGLHHSENTKVDGGRERDSDRSTGVVNPEESPESDEPIAPSCVNTLYPQLNFSVNNLFLLGSPVAVFLMIRNQRAPLSDTFYLKGCRRVFNIFHPFDPVAYRVEPCIDPRNADFEPMIMSHWNGGLRVQYQTKRLWRMLVDTTWKTQQNMLEALEKGVAGMGLLDRSLHQTGDDDLDADLNEDDDRSRNVNTGVLNQSRRIDYMLQEKEIESANEYVAALAAHSSYWLEKDLSLFIARQLSLSETEIREEAQWENC